MVVIGIDTSSPVVHLPVSTVNTVATHAYGFKPIPYFRAYTLHTYITCTHLYPAQNHIFSTKKFVQPSIGISIAVADGIRYRAPARYRSNPT